MGGIGVRGDGGVGGKPPGQASAQQVSACWPPVDAWNLLAQTPPTHPATHLVYELVQGMLAAGAGLAKDDLHFLKKKLLITNKTTALLSAARAHLVDELVDGVLAVGARGPKHDPLFLFVN